ncbi:MAG: tRNA lysidine(34) synthetase TilS [Ferruginibacter sp.]
MNLKKHPKNNKTTIQVPPPGVRGLFQQYIDKEKLFQPKEKLLIAVSGGVDSVVLCELCKQSGFDFAIAHCNFQLRGAESDEDENFIKELARKYNVEIFIKRFDTEKYAEENKLSIQVAARELRYEWFQSIINPSTNQPFNNLLIAHHANDNIETLLINFFKGTGIGGLQGILPKSGSAQKIIRPLLFAKKEWLQNFAREHSLLYREDSSNESNKYTRNYFRNELIPALKEVYPQVEDNLSDNIKRFNEVNIIYQQSISLQKKKLVFEKKGEYHLPVLKLLKTAALQTVLFELTKEFNFTPGQTVDIIKLLNTHSGKYVDSATHRILKNRQWLIISKHGEKQSAHFIIDETTTKIIFSNHELTIERKPKPAKIDEDPAVAMLDEEDIKFPLLLRKWKQGDYFYPLGMTKKKKLSRFFVDKKLSITQKENVWVIEMDKKIIWIIGHRIDNRFKIIANTKNIIQFILTTPE